MTQTVPGSPPSGSDWTVQTADRIESVVEVVRDKTTVPVTKVARAVVYGLIAGVMGSVAMVLLAVAVFRLNVYVPVDRVGRKVYIAYFAVGAIFLLAGMFLWRKRVARNKG
jgi:uncharacterized membrane protein